MERLFVAVFSGKRPVLHQQFDQLLFVPFPRQRYVERAQVVLQLDTREARDVFHFGQVLMQLFEMVSFHVMCMASRIGSDLRCHARYSRRFGFQTPSSSYPCFHFLIPLFGSVRLEFTRCSIAASLVRSIGQIRNFWSILVRERPTYIVARSCGAV